MGKLKIKGKTKKKIIRIKEKVDARQKPRNVIKR